MTSETSDKAPRRGNYLRTLPEGWRYESVNITGPDGELIAVDAPGSYGADGTDQYAVTLDVDQEPPRRVTAPTLDDAVQVAVDAAKRLAKFRKQEAALAASKQGLLTDLVGD